MDVTSVYRGGVSQNGSTQVPSNSQEKNNTKISYSRMAQKIQFPKKDQAIVTDVIEGLTIKDYTLAVGKIVKPANVLFVSRISNGRICVYLSSQELVDKLTEPGIKVSIDTHELSFRPLISKAKRIIISNVCPIIPHFIIEDKMKALDITPVSQITCIRAAINEPEYAHVMSFRRQVYINPEDIEKLPENMEIEYDNTHYWLYFSGEKAICFLCKEEGHFAKHCLINEKVDSTQKQMTNDTQNSQNKNIEIEIDMEQEKNNNVNELNTNNTSVVEKNSLSATLTMPPPLVPAGNTGLKRSSSNLSSSALSSTDQTQLKGKTTAPQVPKKPGRKPSEKRRKGLLDNDCSQEEIETLLAPVKNFFLTNSNNYPLEFDGLSAFLKESYGNSNPLEIAKKLTTDIPGLVKMLKDAYPGVKRNLKSRITRINKKLENPNSSEVHSTNDESEDIDSDSSSHL